MSGRDQGSPRTGRARTDQGNARTGLLCPGKEQPKQDKKNRGEQRPGKNRTGSG